MALTRTKILDPGVSPLMVYLVFSVSSELDTTQSLAVEKNKSSRKSYLLTAVTEYSYVLIED